MLITGSGHAAHGNWAQINYGEIIVRFGPDFVPENKITFTLLLTIF